MNRSARSTPASVSRCRQEIRAIQHTLGIPTLYATHNQDEAPLSDRVVVMNNGHVEQIASPAAIYHQPRTLFVGSLNALPATVDHPASGSFRLTGQCLQFAAGRAPGEPVVIACRPEQVSLENEPVDGRAAAGLRGVVDEATVLGSVVRVRLRCADALIVVDVLSDEHRALAPTG